MRGTAQKRRQGDALPYACIRQWRRHQHNGELAWPKSSPRRMEMLWICSWFTCFGHPIPNVKRAQRLNGPAFGRQIHQEGLIP